MNRMITDTLNTMKMLGTGRSVIQRDCHIKLNFFLLSLQDREDASGEGGHGGGGQETAVTKLSTESL